MLRKFTGIVLVVNSGATVASMIKFRSLKAGKDLLFYRSLDDGRLAFTSRLCSRLCAPSYVSFPKRHFSQVPGVARNNDVIGIRNGRSSRERLAFKGLHKQWKKPNAVGMLSKTESTNTTVFASKDGKVASSEQLIGDGNSDVTVRSPTATSSTGSGKQDSQVKGKDGQHLRGRKNHEKPFVPEASEEATLTKRSTNGSSTKSSTSRKSSKRSLKGLEKSSTLNTPAEVLVDSVSTKKKGSKKSGKSEAKKKSVKGKNESLEKENPQSTRKLGIQRQNILKQLYPPTGKSIIVVESLTKAKTIQGYLGDMYEVLPSYGHVRDLAGRSGSVRPEDDFSMVWEVPSSAWTHLKSIKVSLSGAENLILASDPDREGEAIAWHILEMLQQQDALHENTTVARVVFQEITESSIKNALQNPREIDANLVHAYLARRALDYLIGFNISPLLWRKLPGCQSAGRVQSAALSLICDREMEIDEFKPQEYWTVAVVLHDKEHSFFLPAHLTHYNSKRLNQLSISSDLEANDIKQKINSEKFQVLSSKTGIIRKNPPTPYITSTLQQDAANKLQFPTIYTMKLAQKLYEGVMLSDGEATGLITYMRTDGLHISEGAVKDIRSFITERYGSHFTSESPRKYFKKVKNAQEAHEAIRPTDIRRLPSMLVGILDEDSLKLYTLIWSRTVACQMEPMTIGQVQLDIQSADESILFRSSCSRREFLGYRAVYEDVEVGGISCNDNEGNDREETFGILSSLKSGDQLYIGEVKLEQHHTQPPPRYSEGSLVKKLEELGIGRPSTYAVTLKVLKDRNYITIKSRVLYPEFRGRMVSAFLSHHFAEVTDYSFTADMETELDNVSAGLTEWKGLLRDYWMRFSSYCSRVESVHIHQVEKMLEKKFGGFLFASLPDQSRTCSSCMEGKLIFKVSRYGAGYFIGCDQHPKCKYIAKTLYGGCEEPDVPERNNSVEEPKLLGLHPSSGEKILLKNGPYGFYVQLGEDRTGYLPKRASVSHIKEVNSITIEDALELLRYPVTLGNHPADGQPVILKLARFGFTVRHRRTMASVPKNMKPTEVTLEKALELLSSKDVRRSGRPKKKKPVVEDAVEAM